MSRHIFEQCHVLLEIHNKCIVYWMQTASRLSNVKYILNHSTFISSINISILKSPDISSSNAMLYSSSTPGILSPENLTLKWCRTYLPAMLCCTRIQHQASWLQKTCQSSIVTYFLQQQVYALGTKHVLLEYKWCDIITTESKSPSLHMATLRRTKSSYEDGPNLHKETLSFSGKESQSECWVSFS